MRSLLASSALLRPTSTSILPGIARQARYQSTAPAGNETATKSLSPRWLSDVKSRIGKCIMFGLSPAQTTEAGSILQEITTDWRELVAGSEGFLTGKDQRGLYRHAVVWGEMDSMPSKHFDSATGHVNNVMYNRYAESARCNWIGLFANIHDPSHKAEWKELLSPRSTGLILRSIRTDYKFPMTYPDRVTVLHKLRDRPQSDTDHFILDVLILSEVHRRPAARCVEDIVVYDYKAGRKSPLKPFMVDKFRETFDLQQQARQKHGNRVAELLRRVRELEQDSWDRPDAEEDLGSATNP